MTESPGSVTWISEASGSGGKGIRTARHDIPPSVEEVKAHMDLHLKHYRQSQLVCTDDLLYYKKNPAQVQNCLEYALSNGISFRDDSPLGDWYIQTRMESWSVSHP